MEVAICTEKYASLSSQELKLGSQNESRDECPDKSARWFDE
jgi:hypothetical protein